MDIGSTTLRPKQGGSQTSENPLLVPVQPISGGHRAKVTCSLQAFTLFWTMLQTWSWPHSQEQAYSPSHLPWEDPNSQHMLQKPNTGYSGRKYTELGFAGWFTGVWGPSEYTPRARVRKEEQQAPGQGLHLYSCSAPWRVDQGLEMNQQVCPTPQSQAHPTCMSHLLLPHGGASGWQAEK